MFITFQRLNENDCHKEINKQRFIANVRGILINSSLLSEKEREK